MNAMNLNVLKVSVLGVALLFSLSSCVSMKRFADTEAKAKKCAQENDSLSRTLGDYTVKNNELTAKLKTADAKLAQNDADLAQLGEDLKKTKGEKESLQGEYDEMNSRYAKIIAGSKSETQDLLKDLQGTKADLQRRENDLRVLEEENNRKKQSLDSLMALYVEKENNLKELQNVLESKNNEVKAIRDKITNALYGFQDKGLTIYTKNGKVYVSMDEKLMFASGSWTVSEEGKKALKQVAQVLEKNPDINVMIEGHTDNVPYKGPGQVKDNWDLSVMRATSIVKIMQESANIDAQRITASGHGEFLPVVENDTKENRAKNRRTEIILTPKLTELLKILE